MTGILTAIVLALGIVLGVSVHKVARERRRLWTGLDEEGVKRGLELLLKRGYDGATAVFTDPQTAEFLQFRKYISAPDELGIELHFPRAPWSEDYYAEIQALLLRLGVAAQRAALPSNPVTEVLRADFGSAVGLAARFAGVVVKEVFQRPRVYLSLSADDICPNDELVRTSDHPRPAELLGRRFARSHRRSR